MCITSLPPGVIPRRRRSGHLVGGRCHGVLRDGGAWRAIGAGQLGPALHLCVPSVISAECRTVAPRAERHLSCESLSLLSRNVRISSEWFLWRGRCARPATRYGSPASRR